MPELGENNFQLFSSAQKPQLEMQPLRSTCPAFPRMQEGPSWKGLEGPAEKGGVGTGEGRVPGGTEDLNTDSGNYIYMLAEISFFESWHSGSCVALEGLAPGG